MATKLTLEGKKNIEMQIKETESELAKVREEKKLAYTLTGDTWHDNPYFNKLEQEEERVIKKLMNLQSIIKEAVIIADDQRNLSTVDLGSIFGCSFYYDDEDEETGVFEIIECEGLSSMRGKIHHKSVVAQNLMGLGQNESVSFETPGGIAHYKILKFYKSWDEVENEK